jgi:hypothetical protein
MTPEERREKVREYTRRWRAAHPEKAKEVNLRYKAANREKLATAARAYRLAHPEQGKEAQRRWRDANLPRHAMLRTEWLEMLDRQCGLCYLCNEPLDLGKPREVHVDHDHRCCPPSRSCRYCRRGIACRACNDMAGFAHDDPAKLRRIADNLEAAIADVTRRLAQKPAQAELFDLDGVAS